LPSGRCRSKALKSKSKPRKRKHKPKSKSKSKAKPRKRKRKPKSKSKSKAKPRKRKSKSKSKPKRKCKHGVLPSGRCRPKALKKKRSKRPVKRTPKRPVKRTPKRVAKKAGALNLAYDYSRDRFYTPADATVLRTASVEEEADKESYTRTMTNMTRSILKTSEASWRSLKRNIQIMNQDACSAFDVSKEGIVSLFLALGLLVLLRFSDLLGLPKFHLINASAMSWMSTKWDPVKSHHYYYYNESFGKCKISLVSQLAASLVSSWEVDRKPVVFVGSIANDGIDDSQSEEYFCYHAIAVVYVPSGNSITRHIIDTSSLIDRESQYHGTCAAGWKKLNKCIQRAENTFADLVRVRTGLSVPIVEDNCMEWIQGNYGLCASASASVVIRILLEYKNILDSSYKIRKTCEDWAYHLTSQGAAHHSYLEEVFGNLNTAIAKLLWPVIKKHYPVKWTRKSAEKFAEKVVLDLGKAQYYWNKPKLTNLKNAIDALWTPV
jgi:hypothetical protein